MTGGKSRNCENVDLKIYVKTDKNVIVISGITSPKYRHKVMAKHKLLHGIYKPETQNDLFVLNKINFFLNISSKSCDKFRLVGDFNVSPNNGNFKRFINDFSLDNISKHGTYFKPVSSTSIDLISMFNEVLIKKCFSRYKEM